jgi:hypothetical protein
MALNSGSGGLLSAGGGAYYGGAYYYITGCDITYEFYYGGILTCIIVG